MGILQSDLSAFRGIRLQMSVPNQKPVDVAISRWAGLISDFTKFWQEDVAPAFFNKVRLNFNLYGQFAGVWAPLSPTYAAWKAQHFPGKPWLRRSDRLYRSLTFDGGQVGPEGIARFSKMDAELGTSVPYGIHHQRGTRHMPARPVLVLMTSETAGRMLHRFAVDTLKSSGLSKDAA